MLSERTIINALIMIAGMILGPYLIILTFELNQVALLSFASIAVIFAIFFFVKDRIAFLPMLGTYFQTGYLNFLPFSLDPTEVCGLVAILYYLLNYICLKRRPITAGPKKFLFPILVVGAIILYHSRNLGLHGLGSTDAEGSRPGLLILLAIAAYFSCINIPTPSISFVRALPWFCVALTAIGSIPMILSTYFPSLAPSLFYVSTNINLAAYSLSTQGGGVEDLQRNGALLGISGSLMAATIAYFPLSTWWRPARWIFILLGIGCLYGTLIGGYRNALFSFFVVIFVSTVCYSRWRTLFILPFLALTPLILMLVQDSHPMGLTLPPVIQRTLSFLPGHWDPSVTASAEASNEFRDGIRKVYISEYLDKSPWIGNGYTFTPGEPDAYNNMMLTPGVWDPAYYQSKAFITSKTFHVGWISLYDAVGIIGSLGFVALICAMIGSLAWSIFGPTADQNSKLFPLRVWLFASVISTTFGYFTTFGDFSACFIGFCWVSLAIFHVEQLVQREASGAALAIVPTSLPPTKDMFRPADAFRRAR
jgi:hypothetical protein